MWLCRSPRQKQSKRSQKKTKTKPITKIDVKDSEKNTLVNNKFFVYRAMKLVSRTVATSLLMHIADIHKKLNLQYTHQITCFY
jgi:hypothetical protein